MHNLCKKLDTAFLSLVFALFALIPIGGIVPEVRSIFESPTKPSPYGWIVIMSLFIIGSAFLFCSASRERGDRSKLKKFLIEKANFNSDRPITDILLGIVSGAVSGVLIIFLTAYMKQERVLLASLPLVFEMIINTWPETILVNLIAAPLIEEFFFRRFMIAKLIQIVRGNAGIIISLVMSTVIFAWIHPFYPEYKVINGLIFGGLYIWRKNLLAPVTAHFFTNFTMLFLIVL